MKAIRVDGNKPALVNLNEPAGDGIRVRIAAAGICGSDLHLIDLGLAEGRILGHEFAGVTPDGTAVAVEPLLGCGRCASCVDGYTAHCASQPALLGVGLDGGMAEVVRVPAGNLVPLPSGLPVQVACLVEPLAVAVHGIAQARVTPNDRVLVIGAGAIGLAVAAVLGGRGQGCDIIARHRHQEEAADLLGARCTAGDGYDVVIDAVGSSESLADAAHRVRSRGRIGMVGTFWQPTTVPGALCMKEIELIGAMTYKCRPPERSFEEAGRLLVANPAIAEVLITHRFPLDAVDEAFHAARDRAAGAIKVCFDISARDV
jgi:threonine dehydrogenase-like Zn-dependent dehydrogenase